MRTALPRIEPFPFYQRLTWFTFYNFCRVHRSIRCTPAMEAGISDHVWSVRELLEVA